jgi:hypothetical protein
MLEAEGHAGLSEMVTGVQARFTGHRFRRVSGIDTHHDQVRFAWELVAPDGAVVVGGIDIGALAADGRLRHIAGFFGAPPAALAGGMLFGQDWLLVFGAVSLAEELYETGVIALILRSSLRHSRAAP